ncbi:MAG: NUDIX hydrolase [Calditrichaeota bacterium]|nr:NUDIX hydrolase [Calditrichota bacterium]
MRRNYPEYPIPAVSGVVLNDQKEVLAVQRGTNPGKGQWSLPGGAVHLGEPVRDAVKREVREECGIDVSVTGILGVFDRIFRDHQGRVEYHYVLVSFLCRLEKGKPAAQSDAQAVRWIGRKELSDFDWTPGVKELLEEILIPEKI